ncbi:hypothetical protein [Plantactinospora endophytica]|uniref:Uncharacterized protein n=1 Tax=Plantactinospora endophytica TaxID=673535 RepID=A0ABQ4DWX6_9ACTN|nr:hypothetical protein [Plantactinospora endophytica]GIG86946.1 hypothetical protein Pen02_18820 [Plantactinospora endophytica]
MNDPLNTSRPSPQPSDGGPEQRAAGMPPVFRFNLAAVLDLAEHAVAAEQHVDLDGNDPTGPALLIVANTIVCLTSNGLPPLPPSPGQPPPHTVRVVHPDTLGPDQPRRDGSDAVIALPLRRPDAPLIDDLRAAAREGLNAVTISISDATVAFSVTRVPPAPGTPHHS